MQKKWNVVYKLEAYGSLKVRAETADQAREKLMDEPNLDKLLAKATTIKLGPLSVAEAISEWSKFTKH